MVSINKTVVVFSYNPSEGKTHIFIATLYLFFIKQIIILNIFTAEISKSISADLIYRFSSIIKINLGTKFNDSQSETQY